MNKDIKVLLVDDDEDDFIITEDLLEEIPREYQLEWIDNYQDAIEAIEENRHDVYIVDYRLGAKNGLEIVQEAQKYVKYKPFILLTGQGGLEIDEQAIKAGASDYLVKGKITASQLERSIRHSIERKNNIKKIQLLNASLEDRVKERTFQLDEAVKKLQKANLQLKEEVVERKKAEEALRESQRIYKAIAQNFPNGIITVVNEDYDYVFADGQELSNLGWTPEVLLSRKFLSDESSYQFEAGNESSETYRGQILKVFQGEEVFFEITIKGILFSCNAVPLFNRGKVSQALIVYMNINEQKKAEKEIIKALAKEKELNELKSRFVSMASHEFRTPLSTILSSVSLISRYSSPEQQEKKEKHIKRIKSSVNNLTQILNDFLSLSKLEEGKSLAINSTRIALPDFVEEVCEEMKAVKKPGQQIVYDIKGEPFFFYSDSQLLKNILINLISNAIKYSSNGKSIHVIIEQDANEDLMISVQDEGMGIPEEEQAHLFERFFRAENAINIQGTGLGLHIVKKYLEMIRGDITFKSVVDQGTTFTITIPKDQSI